MTGSGDGNRLFVVSSELRVPDAASGDLVGAFRDRIGLVDGWDGFDRLEVWQDRRDAGRFLMTSWWDSPEAFTGYMRSAEHRRSHDRIAHGPDRPRGVGVTRFDLVAR